MTAANAFGTAGGATSGGVPIDPATGLPYIVTASSAPPGPPSPAGFGSGGTVGGGGWNAGGLLGPYQHYGTTLTSPGGAPWANQMIAYGNLGNPGGPSGGGGATPGSYATGSGAGTGYTGTNMGGGDNHFGGALGPLTPPNPSTQYNQQYGGNGSGQPQLAPSDQILAGLLSIANRWGQGPNTPYARLAAALNTDHPSQAFNDSIANADTATTGSIAAALAEGRSPQDIVASINSTTNANGQITPAQVAAIQAAMQQYGFTPQGSGVNLFGSN